MDEFPYAPAPANSDNYQEGYIAGWEHAGVISKINPFYLLLVTSHRYSKIHFDRTRKRRLHNHNFNTKIQVQYINQ